MELNDYQRQRLEKAALLRQKGIDPYPPRFTERTHSIAQVLTAFDSFKKDDHAEPPLVGTEVSVGGRIYTWRDKKVIFADLIEDGTKIQLYFKDNNLEGGKESLDLLRQTVDLGDIIGVVGKPFVTKTGEKSLEVHRWKMLTKTINTMPDKYHGLTDKELRYRQRYADLIANLEVRDVFVKRSRIVSAMRHFMDSKGFMEVETPTLQPIYGGAAARPFTTHYNALDQTFYLRIADELYLKRLLVGGYSKVYEICKDFRNEGIDVRHNPEFTMMECYQAFADYNDIMALVEEMIPYIAQEVLGTLQISTRGHEVDLTPPWRRLRLRDALLEYAELDYEAFPEQADLYREVTARGVEVAPDTVWPKLVDEAMKVFVVPKLIQPTFLYDYPQKLSPLAKRKPGQAETAERFQPFIAGLECGNAFSELNDPMDQRERFLDQGRNQEAGDDEAMQMDDDFINALMYGMPPTGGLGIGIDRLTMMLLDQPAIRDVILFPQMRNIVS
ncbi:MAG: lysine--tRNA ligase [Chloroflexota bacterium]